MKDSVALNFAAAFGVNDMLSVILSPGAMVTGRVGEFKAKYLVEIEALLIVTAALPELVAVTFRVLVVFGLTSPKSRLALPSTRFPDCWPPPELDSLNPWQPMRAARADRASARLAAFPIRLTAELLSGSFRITFTNYPVLSVHY